MDDVQDGLAEGATGRREGGREGGGEKKEGREGKLSLLLDVCLIILFWHLPSLPPSLPLTLNYFPQKC